MNRFTLFVSLGVLTATSPLAKAGGSAGKAPASVEFFEREVRPILVERCQSCHGSKNARGGLRLTGRAAVLKGGDSGVALVPGKPAESRLIQAVEYGGELKMPPAGKLPDPEIARLKRWVELGAPWPGEAKASV